MIYCLIAIVLLLLVIVAQNSAAYRAAYSIDRLAASVAEIMVKEDTHKICQKLLEIHEAVLMIRLQTQRGEDIDHPQYP